MFFLFVLYQSQQSDAARDKENQEADVEFLSRCKVARDISYIKLRSGMIVLARCNDGRWGIAYWNGWMHRGQNKYIASKWKEYTGHWPILE